MHEEIKMFDLLTGDHDAKRASTPHKQLPLRYLTCLLFSLIIASFDEKKSSY